VIDRRVTVVGAGAIGGYVAAKLAAAGVPVDVCDRNSEHVEAIRRHGLRVSGAADLLQRIDAVHPDELEGGLEIVLLAVKTGGTGSALDAIAPHLAADGFVVSLQNGLQEYEIAERLGPERTIGGFLTFGGHYVRPGELAFGGPGSLKVGELDGRLTDRAEELASLLSIAHVAQATRNIFGFLWAKTAILAFYFASALSGTDVQDLIQDLALRPALDALVAEVVDVAAAEGVTPEVVDGFDPAAFRRRDAEAMNASWRAQLRYWDGHESRRTGIWRDLAVHQRLTEVEGILVPVLARGRRHGIPTPLLELTVEMTRAAEARQRELGMANVEELARACPV